MLQIISSHGQDALIFEIDIDDVCDMVFFLQEFFYDLKEEIGFTCPARADDCHNLVDWLIEDGKIKRHFPVEQIRQR